MSLLRTPSVQTCQRFNTSPQTPDFLRSIFQFFLKKSSRDFFHTMYCCHKYAQLCQIAHTYTYYLTIENESAKKKHEEQITSQDPRRYMSKSPYFTNYNSHAKKIFTNVFLSSCSCCHSLSRIYLLSKITKHTVIYFPKVGSQIMYTAVQQLL